MHSPCTSLLQGPEITRGRGDWLPRDTSTWGPKRPQVESRGVLQKLETASTPQPTPPHQAHAWRFCPEFYAALPGRVKPRRRPDSWARISEDQARHPLCRWGIAMWGSWQQKQEAPISLHSLFLGLLQLGNAELPEPLSCWGQPSVPASTLACWSQP